MTRWQSRKILIWLGIFVAAFVPRLAALGRYITPDELIWVFRSIQFREALLAGQWAETIVSVHPGVTTTWAGTLGISLQLFLRPEDGAIYEWLTHVAYFMPDNMAAFTNLAAFLSAGRVVTAVCNSLGLIIIYELARRLLGNRAAFFAVLFLAFDPFLIGLSGLLHVDGLMTTLAAISMLAMLLAVKRLHADSVAGWRHPALRLAAFSGITAAAAFLSKLPAIMLLPTIGLLILWSFWAQFSGRQDRQFGQTFWLGGVWGVAFVLTALLLLPALWADPTRVFDFIQGNAGRHVVSVLRPTFFLGETIYDPGFEFYPIALIFRLSPVVFIGLIVGLFQRGWRYKLFSNGTAVTLFVWTFLFLGAITFAVKKFDRYMLAVIPALIILAAMAWAGWMTRFPQYAKRVGVGLTAVQLLYWAIFAPYPLAAYNPLVGGPIVAERVLPIGWGEAIGAAGEWLSQQPNIADKTAVAGIAPAFVPFYTGQTLLSTAENRAQADYIIQTAAGRQLDPDNFAATASDLTLLHTIHFGGLDQAWIFSQSQPQKPELTLTELPAPVTFNNQVRLLATKGVVNGDKLDFYARWQLVEGGENGRYTLKFSLHDEAGHHWTGLETELVNETYFYPEHWPPDTMPERRYTVHLPAGLPPDTYQLELSLFDTYSGARLPVIAADGAFQGVVYTEPDIIVSTLIAGYFDVPVATNFSWLDDRLVLLGHSALPEQVLSGGTAVLDLYWQANASLPPDLTFTIFLGDDEMAAVPISRYDSGQWQPGDRIYEKISLTIPPETAAGTYAVKLRVANSDPSEIVNLGQMQVDATDRLFSLPDTMQIPLAYDLDGRMHLRGLNWSTPSIAPGETVEMTLFWQTDAPMTELISAFVHVIGPDGGNVAQADRWPGGLPSDTWAGGQVIADAYTIALPPDAPLGDYQLAVGLYTAVNGLRLPVVDAGGTAVPDNRIILPITLTVGEAE